jgi:hypothetical protein
MVRTNAFGVAVRDRRAHRRQDHPDAFAGEDRVEDAGELGVAIADHDTDMIEDAADREVPGLLGDPGAGRIGRDSRQVHATRPVLDEDEDVKAA